MADTFDDGELSGGTKGRAGFPVEPTRLFNALWQRRYRVGFTMLFFFLFALVYVKAVMGNAWTSQALLQYEGDVAVGDIQRQSRFAMAPAAEVLTRRSLLKKVQEVANYQGSVIALRNSIDYKLDFNASTLRITVAAGSAQGAAELVRHVTDVFLEHHSDRQARRIEQELQRLQVRLDGAKAESRDARNRYAAFLDEHGIPHGELEEGAMGADVVETLAQSELIASEVRALEARVASLQAQLSEMPKTTSLAGSDPARDAYDALRSELAVARASLSADHPRVRSLEEQVAKLSRQLRRGGGDINVVENDAYTQLSRELREAEWQLASLRERQKGLQAIAASAQRRADAITGVEGEAAALLAAVEVNEALVARLQATEAALEDALETPPSGFVVLDPGAVPDYPEENKQKKIVFIGISGLGVLIALFFALRLEFRGLRLKTPSEVAFWGGGPVLASTTGTAQGNSLEEIVASLDDHAPDANGKFLLLGGTPSESRLASELAQRLTHDWFHDVSNDGSTGFAPGSTPVAAPAPSGPYPVGGSAPRPSAAPTSSSTALALRPVQLVRREPTLFIEAWDGPPEGRSLRRAARLADRVVILVGSGTVNPKEMLAVKHRLGRESGIGFIVVGVPEEYERLPDRVGDVSRFWAM